MKTLTRSIVAAVMVLASGGLGEAGGGERAAALRIGVVNSLFQGMPEPLAIAAMQPLSLLMESQAGIKVKIYSHSDAMELAQQIVERQRHLGIINGVEFAWAQQRYPGLRALALAVNQSQKLRACLVVPNESRADRFIELKGTTLAFFEQS